ncbi:MAG: hypothetical protein GQ477_01955 [Nanohaloarchaea archaeon]|nr:hypothetical protein [Candidatus Nanohaloarchaea archaeon]
MNKKNIAFTILALTTLAIIIPYIFAASNYIEGTVINLENGNSIGSVTIDIVNCTDQTQIFNTTTTYANGTFQIEYNNTWGQYLINASGNPSYIDRQFNNNTQCFENGTDLTLKLYPVGTSSLNIILKDSVNSRPIPNAIVKLSRSNYDSEITQINNSRCTDNICKTGTDGTILLIVPNPGTYNITITSEDYDNWNETLATFNESTELGKNRDYAKQLRGSGIISGKVTDYYNSKNVESATIELYRHDTNPYSGENLSFEGIYNYTTTTDADSKYTLYIPPSLILSTNYDISASHNDWTQTINYNGDPNTDGGWDSLNTNIDVHMKGTLRINGSITDCNNNEQEISLDIYITDKSGNGFDYYTHTDNGNFSIFVKNTTTGYAGYNITINGTQYDATTLANAQQEISECVDGSQKVNGTVKDSENNQNIENATIIINLDDGNSYNTITAVDGTFEMDIKDNVQFTIDIAKTGYTGLSSLTDTDGNYETINLTGAYNITGYVEDKEGSRRTSGAKIENVIITVLNQTTRAILYATATDGNGQYSINIPSNINYTLSWNKNFYNAKEKDYSAGEDNDGIIYLKGNTHIDGYILDESSFATDKNITADTTIDFADINGKQYTIIPQDGIFTIDMAIDNYNITVSKPGYDTKTETGFVSGSSITQNINLRGSLNITITTTDNFSNQSISLINLRLFDKDSGIIKYDSIATLDGTKNIFVNSENTYNIAVYHNNYLPLYESINTEDTTFEKEYRLVAKYETKITDAENNMPVENAKVQAYHYFNQTYHPMTLNETTLQVTVNCSGMLLDNINVTVTGPSYSNSQNTIAGTTTFAALPIETYTVEANGSTSGCSTKSTVIDITQGGTAYNTTILLNTTILMIHVTNPNKETIYPANVTYENSTGSNITMQGLNNQYYYENYIELGNYTTTVNESNHHNKTVLCNVTTSGEINFCNITLQPLPGNISIYLLNSTGNPITGAIINITNATASYEIIATDGWANFTDIESLWNLTIDAIDLGYQNQSHNNIYTYPNTDTTYTFTLNQTKITINVTDDLGILENANVSLTDPSTGATLKDYLGNPLSALTDSYGSVTFTRFNISTYNITINESSHDFYNQTLTLTMDSDNDMQINLDTTRMTINVIDTYSTPLADIYVSLNKTDGTANFTGYTNSTGTVILENQTFPPGLYNLTVNGTSLGYNYTEKQIDIYGGSQNIENIILEEYRLKIQVNSSYDNSAAKSVNVTIEEIPQSKNTDENGTAQFRNLENKTYTLTINGTQVGYNDTVLSINVTGDITVEILLEENTFKIEIKDEEGNPVSAGIDVVLWNPYPTLIYDDALGNNLEDETTPTNNNITFRLMQYESSPGNNITMLADGSDQGYGTNLTDYTIFNGTNGPNTTILNITQLLVNVTNSTGAPVNAANVTLLTLSGGYVQNGLGGGSQQMNGTTASDGTITFKWLLPDTYNVSIEKNVSGTIVRNSTLVTITAGEHKYVHIDPNNTLIPSLKGTYYNSILENDTYDLQINTTGLAGPVENITVKVYATGYDYDNAYWYNYEATDNKTTDANGIIVISNIPAGVYDILIDGESKGYGITKTKIQFGKLVFSEETTGGDGIIEIQIDGQPIENAVDNGYFIRVTAAGYKTYDTFDNGEEGLKGTYYDNINYDQTIYPGYTLNNRTDIALNGIINLVGQITDSLAVNAQPIFKNIANTFIELIMHGTGTVRYTAYTDSDGNYSINISPALQGATDINSPLTYDIKTTKIGYRSITEEKVMPNATAIITQDIKIPGSSTINGSVYTYDNKEISGIIVKYIDNATLSEIYKTTTDTNGEYNITINPDYQPYILSFSDPTSNTKDYTSPVYTEPHTNEKYYLLGSEQATLNIYIIDNNNVEVENAEVTINSFIDEKIATFTTDNNGRVDLFIDGIEWNIGEYTITTNGKTLGYGLNTETKNIIPGYNTHTSIINTTRINLSISSNLGNPIYNTTAYLTGDIFISKNIENNTAIFNKILSGNYTINLSSPYFSQYTTPIEINDSNAGTQIQKNIILNESMISIKIINQTGNNLENISISVNGPTSYTGKTDTEGWLNKTQILEGNYTITFTNTTEFTDNNYFIPQNISTTQTIGNTTHIEVKTIERIINVTVNTYDLKDIYNTSRTKIADNTITISLTNETGLTSNKTGDPNTKITNDSTARFTSIYDGIYTINTSSINYTSDNITTFNTTSTNFNTEQNIYLKQNYMAYININILAGSTPISNAQATLYWNATTMITTGTSDQTGRIMLPVNASIYNSTLHIKISKTGYVTKTTADFNITIGEIHNNITSLSLEVPTYTPNNNKPSSSSPSSILPPPTTSDNETNNNTENNTDTTQDIPTTYTYTDNKEEIEQIIKNNINIYNLLEQSLGQLSENQIATIAQNTETYGKYIEIKRDIIIDENGMSIISLDIHYTGNKILNNFAIYDALPKNILTTDNIKFNDNLAEISFDKNTDSYLIVYPNIEPNTYLRTEYQTERYISSQDTSLFSKPQIFVTDIDKDLTITQPNNTIKITTKKSILDYWWLLILAAIATIAGIIITRQTGKQSINYSFKPIETTNPMNPPDTAQGNTMYNFEQREKTLATLPKQVVDTIEKTEEKISQDIRKVAQNEVAYLAKTLEKERFIVD